MTESRKSRMIAAALAGLTLGLVTLGFLAGRYTVIREFGREITSANGSATLAQALAGEPRRDVSLAYYDPDDVRGRLHEISWSVPNMPTPFVGSAPVPGQHGIARINAAQFRAGHEVALPKPPDTFRIILTGGSTAYGAGAPADDRTIAGCLSRLLTTGLTPTTGRHYEVYTMANPGWCSTHERIIHENRLPPFAPDLVISFSGNNDVHWALGGGDIFWFRNYADVHFLRLVARAYELNGRPAFPELLPPAPAPVPPAVVAQRLLKNVRLSAFALAGDGIAYWFVLQPTLAVTAKPLTARERGALHDQAYFRDCYGQMDQALTALRLDHFRYVNFAGIFDQRSEQEQIFIDAYHFGDRGNELVAAALFAQLKAHLVQ